MVRPVESQTIKDLLEIPTPGSEDVAFLTFPSESSLKKFTKKKHTFKTSPLPKLTAKNLISNFSSPPHSPTTLKSSIDSKISSYELTETSPLPSGEKNVDADGWEVVTHSSSSLLLSRRLSSEQTGHSRPHSRKRVKKRLCPSEGLNDFYRFQKKEKFRNEREGLRSKWKEDRERVRRINEKK
ncbi:hypothetical protein TrVE_jg12466 [Triparma verrucosa]|uniref:Ribosomal RNA-processing protein 7 C-terminal domain-containing protein n=1 Tax=Triparma verrucosa TaxID=1606542 RepID=A0A9W7BAK0_9STRA|nr:hypothetical protein TrVE_jg12466 [Triparma verrucosa]